MNKDKLGFSWIILEEDSVRATDPASPYPSIQPNYEPKCLESCFSSLRVDEETFLFGVLYNGFYDSG